MSNQLPPGDLPDHVPTHPSAYSVNPLDPPAPVPPLLPVDALPLVPPTARKASLSEALAQPPAALQPPGDSTTPESVPIAASPTDNPPHVPVSPNAEYPPGDHRPTHASVPPESHGIPQPAPTRAGMITPQRVNRPVTDPVTDPASIDPAPRAFLPLAPANVAASGLTSFTVEALVIKALNSAGAASSRQIAEQIKLPGDIVRQTLDHLRNELLVVHRGTSDLVDYVFQLTEEGTKRLAVYSGKTSYCGAAPVTLSVYNESVKSQAVAQKTVNLDDVRTALNGMFLTPDVESQLAQAVNAGRGLFLYGLPGNGKTSVAARLMASYPEPIWIPRAIEIGGDVMRLFDPSVHKQVNPKDFGMDPERIDLDRRWVLIQRPTVIVGGELTLDYLDIRQQPGSSVLEAPVQLKSNGGSLVIDDFGRQRVSPVELLNRWIVPLERREDFLRLPNGRQIQVPFLQTLILSTNLEPSELIDEAFLRRIPYKIEMPNPTPESFQAVFDKVADDMKIRSEQGAFEHLMNYYQQTRISIRYCHARDLLLQIDNLCDLHGLPRIATPRTMDAVIRNYFNGQGV